jgi:acyl carrier protein
MLESRGEAPLETAVRTAIAGTLDLDVDELPEHPSQDTVPAWTSVSHLVLLLNLEQRFHVRFSLEQMVSMTSAERIVEVLNQTLPPQQG